MITFQQARENLEPVTLRRNDVGDMVFYLQIMLQKLGYYTGSLDKCFGAKTQAALRRLQEYCGVSSTGEFDVASWYALNFWLPSEVVKQPNAQSSSSANGLTFGY